MLFLLACAHDPPSWETPEFTVEVSRFQEFTGEARLLGAAPVRLRGKGRVTVEGALDAQGDPAGKVDLPATLYVEATEPGTFTVRAEEAELIVTAVPVTPKAGIEVEGTFHFSTVFGAEEDVESVEGNGLVFPHRSLEEWADGSEPPPGEGLGSRWDLVSDRDGDGTFSPGDGLDQDLVVLGDFSAAGPYTVTTLDESGGDWLDQRSWWPEGVAAPPLVVISHGNGHDYTWYDYLGEHLASWGYVVMAHSNHTQPGIETASETTLTNTDWFLANHEVDASRIAWIGHSRGGEGIIRAYTRLRTEAWSFGVDTIRVLAPIAPTVFNTVDVSDPAGVRFHLLAGSSDGDVTGGPNYAETQWFRLYQAATATRSSTYIYGASHEDFDCCGRDDGKGPDQLEREDVQAIAKAYLLAVVAEALDEDPYATAALAADPMVAPAAPFDATVLSTWRPVGRLVIDDFQVNFDPDRASSGAPVTWAVAVLEEGALDDGDGQLEWSGTDAMNGMTQAEGGTDDARGLVFEWEAPGSVAWELPSTVADWSERGHLVMDVCQGTRHPLTDELDGPLTFSVTVVDGSGVEATARVVTPAAPPYLRGGLGDGKGWSNAFSTVRIALADFPGVDLADVHSVRIDVGGEGDAPVGRLGLDALEVE